MIRPAWVDVDLGAISHNVRQVKTLLHPETKLCAVVKANGYGHGAQAVARVAIASGAEWLAVAILDEALDLRNAGFTGPILVLSPAVSEGAFLAVSRDISQTVCCPEQAYHLSVAAQACGREAKVHIKIDSGMGRIGVAADEAFGLMRDTLKRPGIKVEGIYSHLATADEKSKGFANQQIGIFKQCIEEFRKLDFPSRPLVHICNSAATINFPEAHFDMVRVGLIIYGLWPSQDVDRKIELRPAMALKCRISQVKTVKAGTSISYGRTYRTQGERVIASLPIGYADGLDRSLSNNGYVTIRERQVPIVGRICMDQCMVDVTDVISVQPGDEALLFGGIQKPVEDIANLLDTVNYEIVARIGARLPRYYHYNAGYDDS